MMLLLLIIVVNITDISRNDNDLSNIVDSDILYTQERLLQKRTHGVRVQSSDMNLHHP